MRQVSDDTCGSRDLCEVGVLLNVGTESVGSIDGAGCLIPVSVHVITVSCVVGTDLCFWYSSQVET